MPRGSDIPPLFSSPTPLGLFSLALGLFSLFGGKHEAARQKIFQAGRERNAARGWKPGDNMNAQRPMRKEQAPGWGGEQQKTRDTGMSLPPASRAVLDKLDEVTEYVKNEREIQKQREVARRAQQKGLEKEAARKRAVREQQRTRTRDTGVFGGRARTATSGVASGAVFLIDTLQSEYFRRIIEARRRLRLNRRGALAQRSLDPLRSRTNRTAAGDAGRSGAVRQSVPEQSGAGDATARRTGNDSGSSVRSSTQSGTQSQHETARSVEAKRVMEQSRPLPQQASASRTASPLANLARLGVAHGLMSGFSTAPRARSSVLASPRTGLTSRTMTGPGNFFGLTALESQGVGSPGDPRCRCPAAKPKKRREPSCKNPVISRTVKDGIRTTKVQLKCPPSKPKLP